VSISQKTGRFGETFKLARWVPRQTITKTERSYSLLLLCHSWARVLGTTIVAALFKRRCDAQLETQKGRLQRSSRVHERQVDALLVIHAKLEQALFYLQRAASAGKFAGESDQELLQRRARDLAAASNAFSQNKLLIGPELTRKLDEFFNETFSAGMDLNWAEHPMIRNGETRASFFDKAWETASRNCFPYWKRSESKPEP
jgi:hypothetical protein